MRPRAALRLLALAVGASLLWACSAYDSGDLMKRAPQPEVPGHEDGGAANDASLREPTATAGRGSSGSGGVRSNDPGTQDAAQNADGSQTDPDASAPPVDCTPNPGSDLCPLSCPERCNAGDDDCDGKIDEGSADLVCAAAHTVSVCSAGECLIVECRDGYRDCNEDAADGCEVAPSDPAHCGACGHVCTLDHASATCEAGNCLVAECEGGWGDCDGDGQSCETPLNTLEHCGACDGTCMGLAHASPQCDTGTCLVKTCLGNFADCNGEGEDGCETPLDELDNCSACSQVCDKASCGGGVCTAVVCGDPLADCDRDEVDCEIDLSADVANCGGCGLACKFATSTPHATLDCMNRNCRAVCAAGYGDCDEDYATGCESVLDDPTHCGTCNANCNTALAHSASTSCNAGSCELVSCASGWADCDGVDTNGCEHNVTADGPCLPDPDCIKLVSGTHEYYFCPTPRTWQAARDRCRAKKRGDLVSIDSGAENMLVQSNRKSDSWIGARDDLIEGLWRWSNTGVPFWRGTKTGATVLSQYANWNAAQPDNAGNAEDCAEIYADGTWNDNQCGATRAFVCELPPDECPNDASKIEPGQCGCGNPDTDADNDGFAACKDSCESDASKQAPGVCGCGKSDVDADADGTPDCNDLCPLDATKKVACLGYAPANFDPKAVNWSAQPASTLNCGTTTIDTTDPDGTGPLVATVTNWCGTAPVPIAQSQGGGPELVIIPLRALTLSSGNTLRLVGPRPLVLAVDGNATIDGTIDASAGGTTAGAGGNWSCTSNNPASQGGNGGGDSSRLRGASGGGGGGFGTSGGKGGTADTNGANVAGGAGGVARGSTTLTPLYGGCPGGRAGDCSTAGGAGGGALQISVSGTLDVNGTIRANGASGATPCAASDEGGGTGGGSGGAIFLEAKTLDTSGSTLQLNGGSGGRNGQYDSFYSCGNSAGGAGSTSTSSNGGNGISCVAGSPGGGGGYGRLRTLTH